MTEFNFAQSSQVNDYLKGAKIASPKCDSGRDQDRYADYSPCVDPNEEPPQA